MDRKKTQNNDGPINQPSGLNEHADNPSFLNLFDLQEIQALQDAFSNATGVASIITDPLGVPITKPSNFCRLCISVIRSTPAGLKNCMASDATLGKVNPGGPIVSPCLSGGLWDGGTSIMFGENHVANWLIGQVLDEDTDLESMYDYGRSIGADMDAFTNAIAEVPRMKVEAFRKISEALFLFGKMLSRQAIQNHALSQTITTLETKEAELESKNRRLTELINALEDSNAELERFTYTVSHDLKSPLITISGFLGLLELDLSRGDQQSATASMARIREACTTMQRLLDELLELSRIGRLDNEPEQIDLEEMLRQVALVLSGPLDSVSGTLHLPSNLPNITGDRARIFEIFLNLIENSIKYRDPQRKLEITVGILEDSSTPTFFVKDNGIGISPHYHDTIFGLFNQLDQRFDGSGIGLAMVKRIVEYHGGAISVYSEGVGHGTTFTFSLPGHNSCNC